MSDLNRETDTMMMKNKNLNLPDREDLNQVLNNSSNSNAPLPPKPPKFNRSSISSLARNYRDLDLSAGEVSFDNPKSHKAMNHKKSHEAGEQQEKPNGKQNFSPQQVSVVDMSSWMKHGNRMRNKKHKQPQVSFPMSTATIGAFTSKSPNYLHHMSRNIDGRNIQKIGDYLRG